MDFTTGVKSAWSRYAQFSGRSCRAEYWYFRLAIFGVNLGLNFISAFTRAIGVKPITAAVGLVSLIFLLAVIIPSLAVDFRRLHDLNKSAWWLLLALIPIIGWLILLFWVCQPGSRGPNSFGSDPLGLSPNVADEFS